MKAPGPKSPPNVTDVNVSLGAAEPLPAGVGTRDRFRSRQANHPLNSRLGTLPTQIFPRLSRRPRGQTTRLHTADAV